MPPETTPPYTSATDAILTALRAEMADDVAARAVRQCMDHLYRARRIDLSHARIMTIVASRGIAPAESDPIHEQWLEALLAMESVLGQRGLI